jgi:hypothetical protein
MGLALVLVDHKERGVDKLREMAFRVHGIEFLGACKMQKGEVWEVMCK